MNTATMPMPGALRLRSVYALTEPDGSCGLLYDLERGAVLEVPEELQLHAAPALETGEPDDELLRWLVREDLLTSEGWAEWGDEAELPSCPAGGEAHARIEEASEAEALAAVGLLFKRGAGAPRLTLHLDWAGAFPGCDLLERIVVEASRLAAASRREVAYELALDVDAVTPAVAAFLADYPFHVRLACGTFPGPGSGSVSERQAWQAAEPRVRLLAGRLPERLTVHCRLTRDARLCDLWSWAKSLGLRHLDAAREQAPGAAPLEQREFESDLRALGEEMASDLAAGRVPLDFQPVTRIVGRLMRSERPSFGEPRPGRTVDVDPGSGLRGMEPRAVADLWNGIESVEGEEGRFPCGGCWARYLCSHSLLRSPVSGAARPEPSEERCAVWRAEVETGLHLYHRLAQVDPILAPRLFDEAARVPAEPPLAPPDSSTKVF